jgi:beta-lactamase superfamily II metal-dependent hydrolase
MATIRIRMYRVGFGDFFLMSVPAGDDFAHVLIDCGVHAHDLGAMPAALNQMKDDTGGRLALVIMTHRHADHISGFASGKDIFAGFTAERVWMSWFEDPNDSIAPGLQARLTAVATKVQAALAASPRQDGQYDRMAGNILGAAGAGNDQALQVLRSFKTASGAPTPVDYYRAGDAAILPDVLVQAGLTAQILGPPTDLDLVAQMDNKAHQYLTAAGASDDPPIAPFAAVFERAAFPWPKSIKPLYSEAQIQEHILAFQPDLLAAAAQNADNAINNQSVVALFGFQGKTMLFSGDAQWGNWANFLFGGAVGAPGHTALTEQASQVLGSLDFYKVGHHGSTNATPIDVVNAINAGCVAMCSTDPGAYGSPDRGTEVPRIPLLEALDAKTQHNLARSDQVTAGSATALEAPLGPPAAPFTTGPGGTMFIDYRL